VKPFAQEQEEEEVDEKQEKPSEAPAKTAEKRGPPPLPQGRTGG
jgi:hypothetical protein